MNGGHFHIFIYPCSSNVQRTSEDKWEAKHIVDLVRIVRTPGRHNYILTRCFGQLWTNLRVRVGTGEDDGVCRHFGQLIRAEQVGTRNAQKGICAVDGIVQSTAVGLHGKRGLVLIQITTPGMDNTLTVQHQDIFRLKTTDQQQLDTGNGG